MKKVVNKKVLKWLDAGIIYPISDSQGESRSSCAKKGGIIIMLNKKNDLIP